MGRGSAQAQGAGNQAAGFAGQQNTNSQALYSTLAPELLAESANPPGMAPTDLAAINTAGQESAGGGQAAAVGQGGLLAARTRNAGGADAAIQQSARDASATASKGALGTQILNSKLKEEQRQGARSGLQGLYGTTSGQVVPGLNSVAENVNADTQAKNASYDWAKYLLDPALSAGSAGYAGR